MSVKAVRVRGMLMNCLQLQPSWKDGLQQTWPLGSLRQPRQVCGVQGKLQLPGDLCQHNPQWLNDFPKPELTMLIFVRADKTVISLLYFNPPFLTWWGKWIHSDPSHPRVLCHIYAKYKNSRKENLVTLRCSFGVQGTGGCCNSPLEIPKLKALAAAWLCWICKVLLLIHPITKGKAPVFSFYCFWLYKFVWAGFLRTCDWFLGQE